MRRRGLHRVTFALAAVYNVSWGIYAAIDPQWLFRFSGLPPMQHPAIFACLGMVIAVYGLLYADVARRPEAGVAVAAVGLLGKILGPSGLTVMIASGEWPLRTVVLCLPNDVIWWLPFTLYLWDARASVRIDTETR